MKPRLLKKLRSAASFGAAIFVDTETVPGKQNRYEGGWLTKFWFGHAKYIRLENGKQTRVDSITFHDTDTFWRWCISKLHKRIPTWLFAHNLGFDLTVLKVWQLVEEKVFSLSDPRVRSDGVPYRQPLFVLDDPPTIIELLYSDMSKLVCVDTLNYWRTSLEKIGSELGFPKGEIPAYAHKIEEWIPYCIQDVEIIAKAILELAEWLKNNDYGGFRFSAPSTAMSAFRHRFLHHPIEIHGFKKASQLERDSYFGGRLECFFIGSKQGQFYEVDVAALYPYVMRENSYPTRLLASRLDGRESTTDIDHLGLGHTARVRIHTTRHVYPIRYDGRLCHTLGDYTTTLAGPELVHALEAGVIKGVYAWCHYQLDPIFTDFVNHFWSERRRYELSDKTTHATFCKLMMNSLYGKFGQQHAKYEYSHTLQGETAYGYYYEYDEATKRTYKYLCTGDRVDWQLDRDVDVAGEVSSPIIASYVTSYGREHMRLLRSVAGEKHTYYIATDALYVDQKGYDNLAGAGWIEERVPGKLSVKHQGVKLTIKALHQLSLGSHVLSGSLKKSAVPLVSGGHQELHFEGLRSILSQARELSSLLAKDGENSRLFPQSQQPLDGVCIYPVEKHMSIQYQKGQRTKSGWINPLHLEQ